jgi:hypothetical protein
MRTLFYWPTRDSLIKKYCFFFCGWPKMKQINIISDNITGTAAVWRKVDVSVEYNMNTSNLVGQTVGGIVITAEMRILLLAQSNAVQNGIYKNNARTEDFYVGMNPYGIFVHGVSSQKIWAVSSGTQVGVDAITFVPINTIINNGSSPAAISMIESNFSGTYSLYLADNSEYYNIQPSTTEYTTDPSRWSQKLGQITWNGVDAALALFCVTISMRYQNAGNEILSLMFYVDGVAVEDSLFMQSFRNNNDINTFTSKKMLKVGSGSTVSLRCSNGGDRHGIYIFYYNLVAIV